MENHIKNWLEFGGFRQSSVLKLGFITLIVIEIIIRIYCTYWFEMIIIRIRLIVQEFASRPNRSKLTRPEGRCQLLRLTAALAKW